MYEKSTYMRNTVLHLVLLAMHFSPVLQNFNMSVHVLYMHNTTMYVCS